MRITISAATTKARVMKALVENRARVVPNINHCRDCERAYEMSLAPLAGHPACLEEDPC